MLCPMFTCHFFPSYPQAGREAPPALSPALLPIPSSSDLGRVLQLVDSRIIPSFASSCLGGTDQVSKCLGHILHSIDQNHLGRAKLGQWLGYGHAQAGGGKTQQWDPSSASTSQSPANPPYNRQDQPQGTTQHPQPSALSSKLQAASIHPTNPISPESLGLQIPGWRHPASPPLPGG